MRNAALLCAALLGSACVFPTDEPTGIEFSWQFLEANAADGDDARRILTCVGASAEHVAAHVIDSDEPRARQGTFRYECDEGFQTAADAQLEASGAFVQLHPGDYDVSLAIETPGDDDEVLGARTIDVLARAATLETWELQRPPAEWTLVVGGVDACSAVGFAMYYDAPVDALAEPPLDDEGEPVADVLYREVLASDRGLGLAGTSLTCADAAGTHVFADVDRGEYRLEVDVDGVICPFAVTIAPATTTTVDLGALPCG